ncbi:LysR family transcriptional regulator [Salinarimonas ramus]|uniref:Hyaluronan synthase n=1 Tax=Salinarimonas ramus TaxID=690164 RepID=A0A917QBB6_9HYPH|nr:LysR family transcriptional regulator [Salinarimonas ramus]GGK40724.1 hyaluronan synthase [Salinarimonas ramus]
MRPTLRQLQYLVAIAETGGVAKAARRCHVSQASLSAQISTMEAELGITVLERVGRGVRPTPLGEEIVRRAREVLSAVEQIRHIGRGPQTHFPKRLRLGVLPSIGAYFMPLATRDLHAAHPELRLFVQEGSTEELLAALLDARLDLLITTPSARADVREVPLFTESLWVCASAEDPLSAARTPVTLDDLAGYPLLTLGEGFHLTRVVERMAQAAGAHVSLEYQSRTLDAVRQMAVMGAGVAVLPSLYALAEAVRDPDFVVRLVDDPIASHRVVLQWRATSPMQEAFHEIAHGLRQVKARIRRSRRGLFPLPAWIDDGLPEEETSPTQDA